MTTAANAESGPDPGGVARESNDAPESVEKPLVAIGIGGRVELGSRELRIVKDTALGHVVDLLWYAYGVQEKRIPLSAVTSIEIIRPLVLPDVFRVTYAGGPSLTGHYLQDALAENALMMNMLDNRSFYDIRDQVTRVTEMTGPRLPPARTSRRWRGS